MNTIDITSIGCLAGELQTPCKVISEVAKQLGITPSARINNVPHYSAADVERIAQHIRSQLVPAGGRDQLG